MLISINRSHASNKQTEPHHSIKKYSANFVATEEVDPEYFFSFQTGSISVPEFEEFLRQNLNDKV